MGKREDGLCYGGEWVNAKTLVSTLGDKLISRTTTLIVFNLWGSKAAKYMRKRMWQIHMRVANLLDLPVKHRDMN